MHTKIQYLLSALLLYSFTSIAQDTPTGLLPCGTTGKVEWLDDYQKSGLRFQDPGDTLEVPLTIHIVGNDAGGGFFSYPSLLEAICTLNEDFGPSAIRFYIKGDINYISNTEYYDHDYGAGREMMSIYQVPETINCYFVSSPAGNCGYSSYNLGIAMAKSCASPGDHTWAHEIGHYLSLPHPFFGWEGFDHNYAESAPVQIGDQLVERVNGKYCDVAGDGFCDTPADYLNYRWQCGNDSLSTLTQRDPNGTTFRSDGSLIMSYSFDNCAARFSEEQQAAMRANLYTEKPGFIAEPSGLEEISFDSLEVISPEEGALVDDYHEVTFSWEPIPNATHYQLDVSILPNIGSFIPYRYFVEGTTFSTADLPANRTYYWRVRPFNHMFTCQEYSDIFSFSTGDMVSSTGTITGIEEVSIYPNPSTAGNGATLEIKALEAIDMKLVIREMTGRKYRELTLPIQPGLNSYYISTVDLPTGIFMLSLYSSKGELTLKLVVGR